MTSTRRCVLGAPVMLVVAGLGCQRSPDAAQPGAAAAVAQAPPTERAEPTVLAPPVTPTEGAPRPPDAALVAPVALNLDEIAWQPGPEALPLGAQAAVLEGTPPFADEQTFTMLIKLPKNYTIRPHQHLVTERITVLRGLLHVGHGAAVEPTTAKQIPQGGLIVMPANHTHYVFTRTEDTVIQLQGVGPWNIFYVNPEDDPRPTPPTRPAGFVARYDAATGPRTLTPRDIAYAPAPPGLLPPGAQMAVLEGDPAKPQTFIVRLKVPDNYRFPVHRHSITDRIVVISGALRFATGDTWNPLGFKLLTPGAVGLFPAQRNHFGQAEDETVLQVMGVGPYDILWANPEDDPARPRPRQAQARP